MYFSYTPMVSAPARSFHFFFSPCPCDPFLTPILHLAWSKFVFFSFLFSTFSELLFPMASIFPFSPLRPLMGLFGAGIIFSFFFLHRSLICSFAATLTSRIFRWYPQPFFSRTSTRLPLLRSRYARYLGNPCWHFDKGLLGLFFIFSVPDCNFHLPPFFFPRVAKSAHLSPLCGPNPVDSPFLFRLPEKDQMWLVLQSNLFFPPRLFFWEWIFLQRPFVFCLCVLIGLLCESRFLCSTLRFSKCPAPPV